MNIFLVIMTLLMLFAENNLMNLFTLCVSVFELAVKIFVLYKVQKEHIYCQTDYPIQQLGTDRMYKILI